MTWGPAPAPEGADFGELLGLCPDLSADLERFSQLIWTRSGLEPRLLELCRIRVGQVLGVRGQEMPAGGGAPRLDASARRALEQWDVGAGFSPLERACLAVADKFVLDPRAVTDADVATLAAFLTPPQIVAFVEALAVFDGFTRFRVLLAGSDPGAGAR